MSRSNLIGLAGGIALLSWALDCPTRTEATEFRLSEVLATNATFSRTIEKWFREGVRRDTAALKDSAAMYGGSADEQRLFMAFSPEFSLDLTTNGDTVVGFLDRNFINRGAKKRTERTRLEPSSPELSAVVPRLMATANSPNIKDFEKQIAAGLKFNYQRSSASWTVSLIREWNGFDVPYDRIGIVVDDGTGLVVIFRDFRTGERFDSLNEPRIAAKQAEATARTEVLRRVQSYQPQLLEPTVSLEGQAALQVEYFRTDALEQAASEEVKRAMKRDLQHKRTHWYPRLVFKLLFIVRGRSSDAKRTPVLGSEFVYIDATTGELLPTNVRK